MAGVSRWFAGLSPKKQIVLGLVGLLLVVWITNAWVNDDSTKAQAARPAPPWAGITKAQALVLAQKDDWRMLPQQRLLPTRPCCKWVPVGFAQHMRMSSANSTDGHWMENPTYAKVTCSGRAYWKLSYPYDEPRPWYESKRRGMNVGLYGDCDSPKPIDIIRHGA